MRFSRPLIAAFFGFVVAAASSADAIAPNFVPDSELASYHLIVVAKWEKPANDPGGERRERNLKRTGPYRQLTKLNVDSVVKGKLKPGVHDLMIAHGITWGPDGRFVNSGTSTEVPGDVDDVTKPCLWFLQWSRSSDLDDDTEFLTVSNYREVQPIELKDYYVAMGHATAEVEVPKLLTAEQPIVAERVLRFICGEKWPWPYDGSLGFLQPKQQRELLRVEADRVWELVTSDAKKLRARAACIYAELSGRDGLVNLRTLLDDEDAEVRAVAVGVLVRHRDEESAGRFVKAVDGIQKVWFACKVVDALAAWKDDRVVAPLIAFLQEDRFSYQYGDDFGIPAMKARMDLLEITGHRFPFDVKRSRVAWAAAARLDDADARKRLLEQLVPGEESPLVAEAIGVARKEFGDDLKQRTSKLHEDDTVVPVRVTNVSGRHVTILKYPSDVDARSPAGLESYSNFRRNAVKSDFVTLKPEESIEIETKVSMRFLIAPPTNRTLKLSYLKLSGEEGANDWIGTVIVNFGTEWKEKRVIKFVEETWPNGNLKAAGKLVNDVKQGQWEYFNEQGDRIRTEYPGTGQGTATHNPEHPNNQGVGKRGKPASNN